ncbi:RecQ family ATP-dependent DNA helicase [Marinitoga litoralis]|uniref:RecQ family ATP-dependent DNA helicase n=1 Tax=Marinitoga litoralis TaxID=570855 RepID=UPI00195FF494|nr:RecQ family ATP-dependent DNA helicase [Marinitoga litoralis]MBM7559729.1 ATP-dependent DNA helicase RecQ [Marinitoga litoralis]
MIDIKLRKLNYLKNRINEIFDMGFNILIFEEYNEYLKNDFIFLPDNLSDIDKEIEILKTKSFEDFNYLSKYTKNKIIIHPKLFFYIYENYKFLFSNKKIAYLVNEKNKYDYLYNNFEIKIFNYFREVEKIVISDEEALRNYIKNKKILLLEKNETLIKFLSVENINFVFDEKKLLEEEKVVILIKNDSKYSEALKLINFFPELSLEIVSFVGDFLDPKLKNIDLNVLLKEYFNFSNFKVYDIYTSGDLKQTKISQEYIIKSILNKIYSKNKNDFIFVASTGSGKSLIYQFISKMLHDDGLITIVISPLKTLMEDQVNKLRKNEVFKNMVALINSDTSQFERENIYKKINDGIISLIYLSPEYLAKNNIKNLFKKRKIGLVVIDEAHVVSTWGNTFRVDYGYLGEYLDILQKENAPFVKLALTATMISDGFLNTKKEIIDYLKLKDPQIFYTVLRKENINFNVKKLNSETNTQNIEKLCKEEVLKKIINNIEKEVKTVIYCSYKSEVSELFFDQSLEKYRNKIAYLTGDSELKERDKIHKKFKRGEIKIIISTKVFGMGVDISDIREVIHYNLPNSLTEYVQEIGRAGRDGKPSFATVFYNNKSLLNSYRLENMSIPAKWQLKHVYNYIYKKSLKAKGKSKKIQISIEDLAHIFKTNNFDEATKKVRISFFIIEKELERIFPNKLLKKTYEGNLKIYFRSLDDNVKEKIPLAYEEYKNTLRFSENGDEIKGNKSIYKLNLAEFLERKSELSYGEFIYKFYNNKSKEIIGIAMDPVIIYKINLNKEFSEVLDRFKNVMNIIKDFIYGFDSSFATFVLKGNLIKRDMFDEYLNKYIEKKSNYLEWLNIKDKRELYGKLNTIFNSFFIKSNFKNPSYALIYNKKFGYNVIKNGNKKLDNLINLFRKAFYEKLECTTITPYAEFKSSPISTLGGILEILNLADIEIKGGEYGLIEYKINGYLPENIKFDIPKLLRERIKKENAYSKYFFNNIDIIKDKWEFLEKYFHGLLDL